MTCPDCEEAKQFMKAQGFRNWRQHACEGHAAVDLDEYLASRGLPDISPTPPGQHSPEPQHEK